MTLKIRRSLYITHHFPHQPPLHALRKTQRTHRPAIALRGVEVLQVSRPAVNADNSPGPGGTQRAILGPPCAQQDGLLVKQQLSLRTALNVRSPVLLRTVDPVERGPCRAVVLEDVDMGVMVGHGLRSYTSFQCMGTRSLGSTIQRP